MHFSSKTDIEAPTAFVASVLSDFEGWERAAMRRGAEVHRTDKLRVAGPGMAWSLAFRFRGKERQMEVTLATFEPEVRYGFKAQGVLIEAEIVIDLLSLAPKRTRLSLSIDAKPRTLGARLLLQSVKLAKSKVQGRLNKRLVQLADDIESRYASTRTR